MAQVAIGATVSRRALGSLNDLASLSRFAIEGRSHSLASRARRYWKWAVFGHSRALIGHIRHPVTKFGWLRRAGFIVWQTVTLPLRSLFGLIVVPRRLLSGREARMQTGRQPPAPGASIPNAM
jgi:hypothetical protein